MNTANRLSGLRRYRLVEREKNFRWFGAVHEYLAVSGNLISSDVAVTHRPKQKGLRTEQAQSGHL